MVGRCPQVAEDTFDVRHEVTRPCAADLLERISDSHADYLIPVSHRGEQIVQPTTVSQHDVDYFGSPAERIGMAAREHVGEGGHTNERRTAELRMSSRSGPLRDGEGDSRLRTSNALDREPRRLRGRRRLP